MKVSTRGRYAVRLMVELAMKNRQEYTSLSSISRNQDVSFKYLEQITSILSKAGFLSSLRGAQGGYRLTKKPEEVTIGDVLRATENSLAPLDCCVCNDNSYGTASDVATADMWMGLYQVILDYLDGITIEDLANKARIAGGAHYSI